MGGRIWVDSIYGNGSVFHIEVPLVIGDADAVVRDDDIHAQIPVFSARVLVVDDIEMNLQVMEAILDSFGIEPDLALSGAQALTLAQEKDYDIIFMDQMMPGMDGIEATKRIRGINGRYRHVPIVALTANTVQGADEALFAEGFNDYLPKPVDIALTGKCLARWLH